MNPFEASPFPPAGFMTVRSEPENTPILEMFRRWYALKAAAELADLSVSDEDMERLYYRETDALEAEIYATPATGKADFAAKVLVAHNMGDFSDLTEDHPMWVEAWDLVGMKPYPKHTLELPNLNTCGE